MGSREHARVHSRIITPILSLLFHFLTSDFIVVLERMDVKSRSMAASLRTAIVESNNSDPTKFVHGNDGVMTSLRPS